MGAAVAVILMKERQVVDAFARAGATSAERAVNPSDLAVDMTGIGARRLLENAALRDAGDGRFFVDLLTWEALRRQRRRILFVLLLAIALGFLFLAGQFPPGAR
jgi:hypothetical protein